MRKSIDRNRGYFFLSCSSFLSFSGISWPAIWRGNRTWLHQTVDPKSMQPVVCQSTSTELETLCKLSSDVISSSHMTIRRLCNIYIHTHMKILCSTSFTFKCTTNLLTRVTAGTPGTVAEAVLSVGVGQHLLATEDALRFVPSLFRSRQAPWRLCIDWVPSLCA